MNAPANAPRSADELTLATWNVNSIRARKERVVEWLGRTRPDIVCLQETKVEDSEFPTEAFEALGYQVAHAGQRAYNGVAIAARHALNDIRTVALLPDDPQKRFIAATVAGLRVVSLYVPNGQAVGSDKFGYKLNWLRALRQYLDDNCRSEEHLLLCGDFNIAPDARDVYDPPSWEGSALYHAAVRDRFSDLCAFGLVDLLRRHHPETGIFTWWDYRMGAFQRNQGLRIDHLLGTSEVVALSVDVTVDREARKGKNASDHAPVVLRLRKPVGDVPGRAN